VKTYFYGNYFGASNFYNISKLFEKLRYENKLEWTKRKPVKGRLPRKKSGKSVVFCQTRGGGGLRD
jgi:hypothetical protein